MKKFEFTMQKVLEYKAHTQRNEKEILARLQLRHNKLCAEYEELIARREEYQNEYIRKCRAGVSIKEIIALRTYIGELQMKISAIEKKIKESHMGVERQIQKVLAVTMEKTTLEKLKKKYYKIYRYQENKEEEIFISEFIANTGLSAYRQLS